MKPTIRYEELLILSQTKNWGFVDVRSPKEYRLATIPNAVNIPVLDDAAREKVGTLYVSGKIAEAKQYGLQWAAQQLPAMYQQYQKLFSEYDELVIFCSRGGMRSDTIFSLLKALGSPVRRLTGGYKSYRRYIAEQLDEQLGKVSYVTLYGLSGCGKTALLKELAQQGAAVLDLEGCANHRGSLLGSIGLSEPHSQKMFESCLFEASKQWSAGTIVFTEGESQRIGKVVIPKNLFAAIQKGPKILIQADLTDRIARIHRDYVQQTDPAELETALAGMAKIINPQRLTKLQEQLAGGDTSAVIEKLLTSYYDPKYSYQKKEYQQTFVNQDDRQTAQAILTWQQLSKN